MSRIPFVPLPATVDAPTLLTLFAVAVVAAAFDAIAGGGGLMTLPALLVAGLDPVAAIATNKLQSAGGSLSATFHFARRGLIERRFAPAFALAAGFGAVLGAKSVSLLPPAALKAGVPIVLIGIALYFALAHRPTAEDARARATPFAFAASYLVGVGIYDGIFGPGAGSFYMVGFVALLGFGTLKATAQTKLVNAASNVAGLAFFALSGKVVWPLGLTMMGGAFLGGQIGSRLAIRHGARLIRPLLVAICCVMALKLMADPANPLRLLLAWIVTGS